MHTGIQYIKIFMSGIPPTERKLAIAFLEQRHSKRQQKRNNAKRKTLKAVAKVCQSGQRFFFKPV